MTIPRMGCIIPSMGTKRIAAKRSPYQSSAIADSLFTKGQQRVLGVLFGNPRRSFFANEIIALAGSGTGAVQRELVRLAGAGLVTTRRVGNQKHYQANSASPVYKELRGLVMKTSGMADLLRAGLAPVGSGIMAAFVFGSVAKGQDTAASDIDLLVISDTLTYAELFGALEPVAGRLGRKVNPTVYSRKDFASRIRQDNAFVKRVLAQPKLWIIGGEDDLSP